MATRARLPLQSEAPKWRIIVTDDDPRLLAQWTSTLRGAGHTVFAAYNGFVALQQASTMADLDLLVTNTRLSGLDAANLIRLVREVRPDLAILHIGEPFPPSPVTDGIATLQEPFRPIALLQKVADLIRR